MRNHISLCGVILNANVILTSKDDYVLASLTCSGQIVKHGPYFAEPNVRGEVSLLAFGTKACSAGDVPKVPKGQGLAPPPC